MNYNYFRQFFHGTKRIKKKSERWAAKFKSMHVLKCQQALLDAIPFVNSEMDAVYHREGRL